MKKKYNEIEIVNLFNRLYKEGLNEILFQDELYEKWDNLVSKSLSIYNPKLLTDDNNTSILYTIPVIKVAIESMKILNENTNVSFKKALDFIEDNQYIDKTRIGDDQYILTKSMDIICNFSEYGPEFARYVAKNTKLQFQPIEYALKELEERNKKFYNKRNMKVLEKKEEVKEEIVDDTELKYVLNNNIETENIKNIIAENAPINVNFTEEKTEETAKEEKAAEKTEEAVKEETTEEKIVPEEGIVEVKQEDKTPAKETVVEEKIEETAKEEKAAEKTEEAVKEETTEEKIVDIKEELPEVKEERAEKTEEKTEEKAPEVKEETIKKEERAVETNNKKAKKEKTKKEKIKKQPAKELKKQLLAKPKKAGQKKEKEERTEEVKMTTQDGKVEVTFKEPVKQSIKIAEPKLPANEENETPKLYTFEEILENDKKELNESLKNFSSAYLDKLRQTDYYKERYNYWVNYYKNLKEKIANETVDAIAKKDVAEKELAEKDEILKQLEDTGDIKSDANKVSFVDASKVELDKIEKISKNYANAIKEYELNFADTKLLTPLVLEENKVYLLKDDKPVEETKEEDKKVEEKKETKEITEEKTEEKEEPKKEAEKLAGISDLIGKLHEMQQNKMIELVNKYTSKIMLANLKNSLVENSNRTKKLQTKFKKKSTIEALNLEEKANTRLNLANHCLESFEEVYTSNFKVKKRVETEHNKSIASHSTKADMITSSDMIVESLRTNYCDLMSRYFAERIVKSIFAQDRVEDVKITQSFVEKCIANIMESATPDFAVIMEKSYNASLGKYNQNTEKYEAEKRAIKTKKFDSTEAKNAEINKINKNIILNKFDKELSDDCAKNRITKLEKKSSQILLDEVFEYEIGNASIKLDENKINEFSFTKENSEALAKKFIKVLDKSRNDKTLTLPLPAKQIVKKAEVEENKEKQPEVKQEEIKEEVKKEETKAKEKSKKEEVKEETEKEPKKEVAGRRSYEIKITQLRMAINKLEKENKTEISAEQKENNNKEIEKLTSLYEKIRAEYMEYLKKESLKKDEEETLGV